MKWESTPMPSTWKEGEGEERGGPSRCSVLAPDSDLTEPGSLFYYLPLGWKYNQAPEKLYLLTRRLSRAKLPLGRSFQTWKETPCLLGLS